MSLTRAQHTLLRTSVTCTIVTSKSNVPPAVLPIAHRYEIPPFLSTDTVKLIGQLLKHKPEHRISMQGLLSHTWLLKGTNLTQISTASTLGDKNILDRVVVQELAKFYSASFLLYNFFFPFFFFVFWRHCI